MLAQSIRASRSSLARVARQSTFTSRRTFITPTAIRQADLVQDMYLRELKSFKPTPVKPSDAEGVVQKFKLPQPPASPEESNLAQDLQAYESQQPEIEGHSEGGAKAAEQDWFEEEEEEAATGHH